MSSHKRDSAVSGAVADSTTPKYRSGRPVFVRYAAQHLGLLAALSITGFVVGIAYRSLIDDPSERDLGRSGDRQRMWRCETPARLFR
jgi:hypothetical protein